VSLVRSIRWRCSGSRQPGPARSPSRSGSTTWTAPASTCGVSSRWRCPSRA
jgi:hypothetical protein